MKLNKITSLALAAALAVGTLGAIPAYAGEASDPEPFTIGFPWDTANTDPTWVSIYNNVEAAVESAGGEPRCGRCPVHACSRLHASCSRCYVRRCRCVLGNSVP